MRYAEQAAVRICFSKGRSISRAVDFTRSMWLSPLSDISSGVLTLATGY